MGTAVAKREEGMGQVLQVLPSRPTTGLNLSIQEIEFYGKAFAASGFFADSRQAAQAIVKIQAGQELGIPPNAAMNGIHVLLGHTSLHYSTVAALIRQSNVYDYEVVESTKERCEIKFLRRRDGQWVSLGPSEVFTKADAKVAGTQNLDKWSDIMLFARTMTKGARKYCPDVYLGPVYVPEDFGAVIDERGEVLFAGIEQSYPAKNALPKGDSGSDFREAKPAQENAQKAAPKSTSGTDGEAANAGEQPVGLTDAEVKSEYKRLIKECGFNAQTYEEFAVESGISVKPKSRAEMEECNAKMQAFLDAVRSDMAVEAEFTEDESPFADGVDTETGEVTDELAHVKSQCYAEEAKIEPDQERRKRMIVGWRGKENAKVPSDPNLWSLEDAKRYLDFLSAY